jgi:hypothetical protein
MSPNQTIIEVDPTDEPTIDSDDSDSDYVPSDREDEEFEADFEEDINMLNEDIIQESETAFPPPIAQQFTSPPDPEPPPPRANEDRRYPLRENRGRNSAIFGFHMKSEKFVQSFGKKGEEAIRATEYDQEGRVHPSVT